MNTLIFYISVVLFFTMFAIKRLSPKRHALSSTSTSSNVIVEEKSRVNKMDRLVKVVSESSTLNPTRVIHGDRRTEV